MTEYISREAVLNDIAELFTLCRETLPNESGHHFIVEAEIETHWDFVKNLPAADVREVVTCGECEFWNRERISCEGLARCLTGEGGFRYRNRRDFCSRGKKREVDDGT